MYIVRNYTALMHLDPTEKINYILIPVPFDNPYGYLCRLKWLSYNLLYKDNCLVKYQATVPSFYPPDTDPHNSKYTYMPIGASIHDVQYMHDFKNYYRRYYSVYINLLIRCLNANN